jgi:tRNA threonylcarbamoyladenosine modification (KEOPS) complex  Pcc1 subunit
MKANAVLRLKFPSQRNLEIIFKALVPEVRKTPTMRSRAFLEKEDNILILKIEANDTVALRATANAYLRWINSMVDVLETLENVS